MTRLAMSGKNKNCFLELIS
jgi:hypothetical protein